jgi:hypothetical protein
MLELPAGVKPFTSSSLNTMKRFAVVNELAVIAGPSPHLHRDFEP